LPARNGQVRLSSPPARVSPTIDPGDLGANTSAGNLWAWSNTNISRGEINTPGTAGVIYGNGGFICASFTYEIA